MQVDSLDLWIGGDRFGSQKFSKSLVAFRLAGFHTLRSSSAALSDLTLSEREFLVAKTFLRNCKSEFKPFLLLNQIRTVSPLSRH